ncbi:hypothetical protein ACFOY8_14075 [Thalassospira xianhensis]|uniref:DUF7768 domain-containing protein n=1 Tax=Thalassospira xianhensis TaxID=478503 RepID=UPI001ABEF3A6|nr:hypothetical protein [Thalassospira xianhensis]
MNCVILETPYMYRHDDPCERLLGQLRNITYGRLAMNDCVVNHGESPYGSHLLLTQPFVLNDDEPRERELGINAGFQWHDRADYSVFYVDLGISSGMERGISNVEQKGVAAIRRNLPGWENACNETPRETLTRLGLYTDVELDAILTFSVEANPAAALAGFK